MLIGLERRSFAATAATARPKPRSLWVFRAQNPDGLLQNPDRTAQNPDSASIAPPKTQIGVIKTQVMPRA